MDGTGGAEGQLRRGNLGKETEKNWKIKKGEI